MSKRPSELEQQGVDKKMKNDNIDSQLLSKDENAAANNAAINAAAALNGGAMNGGIGGDINGGAINGGSPVVNAPMGSSNVTPNHDDSMIKPAHGSEEWHKQRKENHKNVERRRRESINAGIKELAALIPTSDTNKSQILQRAVEYIKRLKENETNNIEKWTLEKLLTEQAVTELDNSNQKLKAELEKCYREIENYKRLLEEK